jgi:hypothetical protein
VESKHHMLPKTKELSKTPSRQSSELDDHNGMPGSSEPTLHMANGSRAGHLMLSEINDNGLGLREEVEAIRAFFATPTALFETAPR